MSAEVALRSPSAWAQCLQSLTRIHLGDLARARRHLDDGGRQFPDYVFFHSLRALIAALKDDEAEALAEIELTASFEHYGHYHHAQHDVACAYAALGRAGEALDWLAQAAANGFPSHAAFVRDPMLEPLRDEPQFQALLDETAAQGARCREIYGRLFDGG